MNHTLLTLLLGLPFLVACSTDPEDFSRCTSGLTLTVSSDVQPEFAWTPTNCPVNEVAVEEATHTLWALANTDPVNSIQSPVRYGQSASPGEFQSPGPGPGGPPLSPGITYVVRVWRLEQGMVVGVAGEKVFQYQPGP